MFSMLLVTFIQSIFNTCIKITKTFIFIVFHITKTIFIFFFILFIIVIKILYDKDLSFIKEMAEALEWKNSFNFNVFQKFWFAIKRSLHRVDQFHVVLPLLENKLPRDICNKIYEFYVMDL